MRKKVTFFVLSHSGAAIKEATISKLALAILGLFLIVSVISSGFILVDYCRLKQTSLNTDALERAVASQLSEIDSQRQQIQNFAVEINTLKKKLVSLHGFEEKIRVIANLEKSAEQDNFFGVGGSIPEDLDARIPLTNKHNSLVREMHEQVGQMNLASTKQEKGLARILEQLENRLNLLASTPAIRPVQGWITSKFGYRKSPFTGLREFHKGLDIATRKGTPIVATADGVVTYAGKKGLMGKVIVIDHGHGMVTRYGHAHKLLKKRRDVIKRGETVALVGNTGRSTGPHVHYEVRLKGVPVNPENYILN